MGVGIFAPVPATILLSAVETCSKAGRVAFGSDDWQFFAKIDKDYGEGLPVLIYPTHRDGDPDKLCAPGYATFWGTYLGKKLAKAGKHPNPAVRPPATIEGPSADTDWTLFWEVGNLVQLAKPDRVAITSLTAEGQKKPLANGFTPRGPKLVKAMFL